MVPKTSNYIICIVICNYIICIVIHFSMRIGANILISILLLVDIILSHLNAFVFMQELIVNQDRYGLFRPTADGEGKIVHDKWLTLTNVHMDVSKIWAYDTYHSSLIQSSQLPTLCVVQWLHGFIVPQFIQLLSDF